MVELEKLKGHLRVPHNLEDGNIQDYLDWAKQDVMEAVYDSYDPKVNIAALEEDVTFKKAVIMLATYYYENRMTISEVAQAESPFSVTHAIQTLRAHKDRYYETE
ncbi:head-tail connector protein [Oceanobacillus jeddahense]|uniref:head-tail connector protein n=1 Tax=Oceanobacillus jeddahense TaxID=1462527 RepID=UPI00059624E0|nr:head-tail connector protein [Oceanobacillus jeddahense]